ncbi:MAG: helix-turn-helix transcriptional regulator [Sphingomonadales bacterium]|nr:helix-turn-helix transcriptional regulator [Sphingomonadales bacterium]
MADAGTTDFTPTVLRAVSVRSGGAELVEWHWPAMIDFVRTEQDLMIEMSLPPMAADASACLPDIAPDKRCFMGTLFVRWPGVAVSGRSEGGHIRVVRCVLSPDQAKAITALRPMLDLPFLHSMLAIRSKAMRSLMRLLHRELENLPDSSETAISALIDLITLELYRLVASEIRTHAQGRLAAWQFRRIRERLAEGGQVPSVAELAALCGISTRHLHRQFLALTGKTVADYIETARLEEAKRLLVMRDQPIKAVALACGFAHANSFARAFRRSTGVSPHAFRQRGVPLPATTH